MQDQAPYSEWRWLLGKLRFFAGYQVLSVILMLAATVLSLLDPLIIKWLLDSGLSARNWTVISSAVAVFIVINAFRLVLSYWSLRTMAGALHRIMLHLRLKLVRKLNSLDAPFFDRQPLGDLVQRLEQDVEQMGRIGTQLLPNFVRIVISVSMALAIMSALNWRLTLMVVPFVPAILLLRRYYKGLLEASSDATRDAMGDRAAFLNEFLSANIQVQLLGAERFFIRRYGELAIQVVRASLRQQKLELLYLLGSLGIMSLATTVVILAGAREYMQGGLTLGGFVAFYSYLLRLLDPVSSAVEAYARLKNAGGGIRRIAQLENSLPQVQDLPEAIPLASRDVNQLTIRAASFGYSPKRPLLRGIDFKIQRGEKAALVGRSGSGKSTLAKLILRQYVLDQGQILLGPHDIRDLQLKSIRRIIAFVPPSPILFRGSLRENVLLGKRVSSRELDRLAEIASFDTVVDRYPKGWEGRLGTAGAGLSDGEKQRLGLLRALVRDRDVLILDEATGALDPAIEADLHSRLESHLKDKIVLLITHRLSTACWADEIYALRDGILMKVDRGQEIMASASALGSDIWGPARKQPGRQFADGRGQAAK